MFSTRGPVHFIVQYPATRVCTCLRQVPSLRMTPLAAMRWTKHFPGLRGASVVATNVDMHIVRQKNLVQHVNTRIGHGVEALPRKRHLRFQRTTEIYLWTRYINNLFNVLVND